MKIFEAIPLTVASKTLKCLGENLPNHTYKILKTKQNKLQNRGTYIVCGFQDSSLKDVSFLQIHVFSAILKSW